MIRDRALSTTSGVSTEEGTHCPHAARIRTPVAVECAFVIFGARQRQDMFAVAKDKQTRLLAFEKFLDDDSRTIARGNAGNRRFGQRGRRGDDDAFALRQSVSLDDQRMRARDGIGDGGVAIVEACEISRRNVIRAAEVFQETLGAFEQCALRARPQRLDASSFQLVPEPRDKGRLGTDDDKINGVLSCELYQAGKIHCGDGHALRHCPNARIARGTVKLRDQRTRGERPSERVLAPARAYEKHIHLELPISNLDCVIFPISFRLMSEPRANLPEYSVSEIAAALKRTVEGAFPFVRVRGEISGLKFHSSGHVYFDLKDDKAVLNAVVWRATAQNLKQKPEQGLEVICTGRISTYAGSSRYQLIVEQIELAGLGALMAMLEERKKKLAAEGLFQESRKKRIPFLPDLIGVITSPTGAVIRDIMHRLDARFPRRVLLWPVAVQGERAAAELVAAIRGFNALTPDGHVPRPDLLIVARGGGSIEDLMAFNEEIVVRAAAESAIPLISAVGHETDTTLLDFAADRRAPTPSAAAEMAVPVRTELLAQALDLERRNLRCFARGLEARSRHLQALARTLPRADQLFAASRQRFDHVADGLGRGLMRNLQEHRRALAEGAAPFRPRCVTSRIESGAERVGAQAHRLDRCRSARWRALRDRLDSSGRLLESVSHRSVLERGFALVRAADGTIRSRAVTVVPGESLSLVFADSVVEAQAKGAPRPAAPKTGQGTLL